MVQARFRGGSRLQNKNEQQARLSLDCLLTLPLLSLVYFLITRTKPEIVPSFARHSPMGSGTIFC